MQLDWVPAAGGDIELLNIIDELSGREDIKEANKKGSGKNDEFSSYAHRYR